VERKKRERGTNLGVCTCHVGGEKNNSSVEGGGGGGPSHSSKDVSQGSFEGGRKARARRGESVEEEGTS